MESGEYHLLIQKQVARQEAKQEEPPPPPLQTLPLSPSTKYDTAMNKRIVLTLSPQQMCLHFWLPKHSLCNMESKHVQ